MFDVSYLAQVRSLYPDVIIKRQTNYMYKTIGYHFSRPNNLAKFSVMFGTLNVCDNQAKRPHPDFDFTLSNTCECAYWIDESDDIKYTLKYHQSPDESLLYMIDVFGN